MCSIVAQKWKRDSPNSKFYFHPYKESTKDSEIDTFDQTLLYIHQRALATRAKGQVWEHLLMDATYKTTKYEFGTAVKTNVGYTAVADFVLQSETSENREQKQSKSYLLGIPNGNHHTS